MSRSLIDLAADGVLLQTASRFEVFVCPACPNAHVVLFDSNDTPFAQMTVGPTQLKILNSGCDEVFKHGS